MGYAPQDQSEFGGGPAPLSLVNQGGEGKGTREGGKPPPPPIRIALGGRAPPLGRLLFSSTKAHAGPLTPRGVPVIPGTPKNARTYPKPFWCRNIALQYINLHVSIISRLLIMSVITSGTLNYLRYIKTQNS